MSHVYRQIDRTHNGGPPLDDDAPKDVQLGEKFLRLFGPERHKAYFGGRGSAKSHSIATTIPMKMAQGHRRVVCARQYQNSIRESVHELLSIKIRELGLQDQFAIYEREIVHKHFESRATFIGLDRNPESAKSLEGADTCWVEEARTVNQRSMEILIPTIRKAGSEIIWSWNPEHEKDPVDLYFRGGDKPGFVPPPDSVIMRVGIEDNPFFYHTAMPNEMWYMARGNLLRYKHVWLGGYDEDYESKIFSNVKIGRLEVPPHVAPRYGADWGFGPDPSFIVKVYVLQSIRTIYVAREFCGHITLKQIPAAIMTVVEDQGDLIKGDSSQPGTIEHLNSEGFNIIGAKKGPGSVKSGINWLQGYQIIIDPECEHLREEARLYSWQVDRITKLRLPVPVDAHNHGWDSVRYATEDAQTETSENNSDGGVFKLRM